MSQGSGQAAARPGSTMPRFRKATFEDVRASLAEGWADFRAEPLFGLFFGGIYAAGGLAMLYVLVRIGAPWMIIPLAIGFPLIAPFVAVGLYEISRRRAAGEPVSRAGVLAHVFRQRERQLGWMAFVVLFIFWVWIYQVRLLLALFLGFKSFSSLDAFLTIVTTTPEGFGFLAVGTLVGTVLAAILFSTTVMALPLLMEREVDFVTAMIASVAAVVAAPGPMLAFGAIVGAATLAALVPGFLGLLLVLPVFGHATWRLYARTVEPG
jgi:Predicted integral membrane protein